MHEEFVGVHGTLNDGFTQAVARGHKNDLIKAAFGVKRKHDACGTFIRAAHSLHARGKRHFHVGKALVDAVADRAVVIKRREHFLHAGKDLIDPDDVEVRFLLAGKGGVREVFSGCRRAHRHGNFVLAVFEPLVKRADFLFEFRRKRRLFNPAADFGAGFGERLHIRHVKSREALGDTVLKAAFLNKEAEGFGRGGKAVRNTDARIGKLT